MFINSLNARISAFFNLSLVVVVWAGLNDWSLPLGPSLTSDSEIALHYTQESEHGPLTLGFSCAQILKKQV